MVLYQFIFAKNDTANINTGVNASILYSFYFGICNPNLNTAITFNYNKSSFGIGAIFGSKRYNELSSGWYSEKNTFALIGISGNYNFKPEIFKSKVYDLIFEYNFIYYRYNKTCDVDEYNPYDPCYYKKFEGNILVQTIGYKIKVKIYKGIYINQNLGIGIDYMSLNYTYISGKNYFHKFTTLEILLKFGIGYDFKINN